MLELSLLTFDCGLASSMRSVILPAGGGVCPCKHARALLALGGEGYTDIAATLAGSEDM